MKNFTNNFKEFTSRLSARWLIMALMLLVGTSSAWGWNKLVIWKSGESSSEVEFNNGTAQITLSEVADYYFYINDNGNKKGLTSTEVKNSSNCKNMSFSGSADCGLRVASGETGLFTFTINSWNGSTPTVSVQYPSAGTYLMGLGDWENGKELPCTILLNAGTYEFKIKKGDTWYGNSGIMTSENSKNWKFDSDINCRITINESGNYYFYVVWADNLPTVSVTYPCEPSNNNTILIECVHTGNPTLYAWDTKGKLNGEWPGSTISYNSSDKIYYKEFTNTNSTESINIIFSDNGAQQTSDITGLEWGKVYRYTRDGELIYSYCLAPACTTPDPPLIDGSDTTCPDKDYILPTATNKGSYTQKWYNSNGTEVTSPVKVSAQTKYTTKLINGTCESAPTEFTLNVTSKPAAPEIEAINNQICEGVGTATISIKEYSSEYTYALYKEDTPVANPNFNSETGKFTISVAGIYRVTATESTCNLESNKSNDITINYYTAPIIDENTYSVTNETLCNTNNNNDGIISLNPTNGVSYSLSKDGITYVLVENKWSDLAAGTYTLTATLDACQKLSNTKEIIVGLTDNTAIKTDISITADKNPICYGTEAKLTCTEISDASYLWNTNETTSEITTENLTSNTTFSVKVSKTENGCTTTKETSITINVNSDVLKPNLTEESTSICSGSSVNLGEFAPEGTVWYENQACTEPIQTTTVFPTGNKTYYAKAKDGECLSSEYTELTINVTTTPVITANKLVTTIGSPITLTSNIDAIWTTTGGILNPNSEETSSVEFTSQNNGRYIITASNTANNITCSASKEVSVQNAFYVYIRRPKSGDNVYNDWYGKTNDAEKGNAPWFKEGTPNYDSMEDTNYGGVGPVESFTDCNDYTWDAFEFAGGNFYIHAPNTSSSDGWATFTRETYIASLTGDVYYYISSFKSGEKGAILSIAQTPERTPEIETPIVSLNPASGILCSGSQATLTVTNPQNDYTYTLMYKGTAQGEPISGNNEVEFTVIEAGSYAVQAKVQSNSGCTSTAFSSASQIKVIATDIKFDATEYTTTPWVPVTVVIEVPSGYEFTYNDATLTSITPEADKPIKKENGHEYIYTFPRPTDWGIGNSQSGDGYDEKPYTITATIKNAEQCGTATATVKLQDEGNDKCILPNQ